MELDETKTTEIDDIQTPVVNNNAPALTNPNQKTEKTEGGKPQKQAANPAPKKGNKSAAHKASEQPISTPKVSESTKELSEEENQRDMLTENTYFPTDSGKKVTFWTKHGPIRIKRAHIPANPKVKAQLDKIKQNWRRPGTSMFSKPEPLIKTMGQIEKNMDLLKQKKIDAINRLPEVSADEKKRMIDILNNK